MKKKIAENCCQFFCKIFCINAFRNNFCRKYLWIL